MNYCKRAPAYLLALTLVIAACEQSEAVAISESRSTITAPADTGTADAAPLSGRRTAVSSYRQRYLSKVAPTIVQCMNDLGWEATYEPQVGVLLDEVPLSKEIERETAMSLCVAGSRTYHNIYAD